MGACCATPNGDAANVEVLPNVAVATDTPILKVEEPPAAEPEAAPAPAPEPEPAPAPAAAEPAPAAAPEPAPVAAAAEPAPAAAPAGPACVIEFDKQTVTFTAGPLGLTFQNEVPLVIKNVVFESEGDKAGVQAGWVFKKIGDVSLDGKTYTEAMGLLKEAAEKLPKAAPTVYSPDAVIVEFIDPNARVRTVAFEKAPLGMSFDGSAPIRVKAVTAGSVADTLGVQSGWQFKSLSSPKLTPNKTMIAGKPWNTVLDLIKTATAGLPTEPEPAPAPAPA